MWSGFFQLLKNTVALIIFLMFVATFALPYVLAIKFEQVASDIARVGAYTTPWLTVLLIFMIFSDQVKEILFSVARAVDRIRRVSAAGAAADLAHNADRIDVPSVNGESTIFTSLDGLKYYLRYVAATIYGSQVEYLRSLSSGAEVSVRKAADYYASFVERAPEGGSYKFENWLGFLLENELIRSGSSPESYAITEKAKQFLSAVDAAKPTITFRF